MGKLVRKWQGNETLARNHPAARQPAKIEPMAASGARNVVFIVNESVRWAEACVAYDEGCKTTPFSNELLKERVPFLEARAPDPRPRSRWR